VRGAMTVPDKDRPAALVDTEALGVLEFEGAQESAWIEVIKKMDEVYSDLIRYEVDLEEKNAALEDAQRFISSVVESVSDVLIVCDRRYDVLQINKAMLDVTGLTENDLVGKSLSSLLPQEDRFLFNVIRQNAEDGRGRECEIRFKTKEALTDVVAVTGSVRQDHEGRRDGLVLTGRPVGELRRAYEALNRAHAELKQAQQQMVQQEKMASLGRLVAGVAHELNNPISFVYGNVHALDRYRKRLQTYLSAIHRGIGEPERERLRSELRIDRMMEDLESLIDGTMEGAERVSEIVKSLRSLSFHRQTEPELFNLTKILDTAVHWATRSGSRPVGVRSKLPEELPVKGHPGQIHQVFVNLVQNAVDAMSKVADPQISIEGRVNGARVEVSVSDNGPGISQEVADKIFEPFYTTKEVGEGTGLGLWISYGIVKEHGGDIKIGATEEGGARFIVCFPAAGVQA